MHEKLEMKTHTLAVAVTAGWPMVLALVVVSASLLAVLPFAMVWQLLAAMAAVVLLTFLWCMRIYLGKYIFLPATDIKGARLIARLGRDNDIEISGVLAGEIIVKQGPVEKLFGVCHIRQKGTTIYLRGVKEPETVRAWIAANFPAERKVEPVKGKKKQQRSGKA